VAFVGGEGESVMGKVDCDFFLRFFFLVVVFLLLSLSTLYLQISEFKNQLFFAAGLQPDKILEFSCGMFFVRFFFV
jgi:hypothetical protein